ncbi:MAG: hypothetical protein M3O25_02920 [Actinomycetota bacterium]|nr:hypothetical protein [Actinomycetota bacterium]
MRTELAAAADHARVAAVLAERTGDRDTQIAALTEQALIDAVTGGTGWRAIVEPGRSLEQRVEPVPVVASATFCLAVVLAWVEKVCDLAELRYERIQEART